MPAWYLPECPAASICAPIFRPAAAEAAQEKETANSGPDLSAGSAFVDPWCSCWLTSSQMRDMGRLRHHRLRRALRSVTLDFPGHCRVILLVLLPDSVDDGVDLVERPAA